MRVSSSVVLALPALAAAQAQIPIVDKIMGFFNQAKDAVTSAIPAAPSSAAEAAASKAAAAVVYELTPENWKQVLTADATAGAPTTQDWVVYINGGESTCYGMCGNATKAWNASVALISAKPSAPKLATLDCEAHQILCNEWSVGPPSIYYMQLPQPLADQSAPGPTVRFISLSRNATTVDTITKIVLDKEYEDTPPYEGMFHPFTGLLQQYGVATPFAYVMWGFAKMPSWLPMILISFFSRSFMGRRQPGGPPAAAAPAQ
ncbi:hypothetical protein P154DRAFT_518711 [Amniculicola lignicola CBS 123094]|uniref:Peptidyl-tRNA hydrolase n=1 Tax=Amniculicola lignicola CBS 123094 TaxID=1392246 RepID=A0A6A5WVM2_9PLEO|nr:hypothetical protein P154DRAFT_518711 [Amniculicola lignicola CBS 123094]